jgi:WbqC-like protein family
MVHASTAAAPLRVAVMQPYFFPYAGYYRLLAAADVFLIFDCVQFIRRGRIHRCELPGPGGRAEWLTLPLAAAARETTIDAIRFAPSARRDFDERLRRHDWLRSARGEGADRVRSWLHAPLDGAALVDYLELTLLGTARMLGLPARIARTSALGLDPGLRSQARVIAAARAVGASHYVNAPGGTGIYDAGSFASAGLTLEFLAPYDGPLKYMLPALMERPIQEIRDEVLRSTVMVKAADRPSQGSARG